MADLFEGGNVQENDTPKIPVDYRKVSSSIPSVGTRLR